MANLEDLVVTLRLEADQMKTQLASAQGQIKNFGPAVKGAEGPVNSLKGTVMGLAGAMGLAFGAMQVISFFKESAKAAAEDNEAQALLARQMKSTVGASDEQVAGIEKQIGALEQLSGVADDQIRPAFTKMLLATKDSTKAMQLTKLAMDVAAGSGKPLGAVTMALSRAASGNANALNRIVPGIKDVGDKMGYLQKQFGGAAKTAADTNPYKRLGVAVDNIKEGLGRGLLPIVQVISSLLQKLVPIFDMLGKIIGKVMDPVMKLVDVIFGALMPPLEQLVNIILDVMDQAMGPISELIKEILVPAFKMIGEWLMFLMPIIKLIFEVAMMRVVIIIKIVVAVLKPFIAVIKNVWNALAPLRRQLAIFIEIVKQVAEQVWNKLVKVFHGLWDFLVKKIVPIWDGLMKAMKPLVDFIKNAFVNSIKNLLNFLKPLWDFIKPMIDGIAKLLGIKIDIKAATKNVDMQEKKDKKDAAKEAAYKFSDSMFGGGLTGTGSKAGAGKVHKTTNIHTKVKVKTDAKPTEIAAQMVNAVKFNLPVLMAGGSGAMDAGMGSQLGGGYGGMGGSGIGAGA